MNTPLHYIPLIVVLLGGMFGSTLAAAPAAAGDPVAGRQLAEKICSAMPTNDSEIRGTLQIESNSGRVQMPVVCQVHVNTDEGRWETVYQTLPTNQPSGARLVIIHHADGPNQYVYGGNAELPGASDVPFAGSDFSIGELGLEFLHWPGQSQLRSETKLSRACYVLESTNAAAQGVVRIKTWIDQESLSPLYAEGFDRDGAKLKEFTLGGSSSRVEKLDIHNKKTHSHTILKLDLPKKEP